MYRVQIFFGSTSVLAHLSADAFMTARQQISSGEGSIEFYDEEGRFHVVAARNVTWMMGKEIS